MDRYWDLQDIWNKLNTDCSQSTFDELALQLFSHYVIKRGEVEFRFLELEMYYFGENHKDWRDIHNQVPFVYERDCDCTGAFFQHQSGVDICFAGKVTGDGSQSNGGGVLIRSLLRKDEHEESLVTGPWDCADALFQYMIPETVPVLTRLKDVLCSNGDLVRTKRCNANCEKDKDEDLCYYDKRFVWDGKWCDLNHDELLRYNATKRCCQKNTYNNKPWNYGSR